MRASRILFFNKPIFGKTACDYAKYRKGFPSEFFQYLQNNGIIEPGKKIVDLGTGTGTIARKLATLKCDVIGIDPTEELLDAACKLDKKSGVAVKYIKATAEKTTLPDQSCDVVIAGQAWHWFDQNAAIAEANRIIKPNGNLIIAHYEWDAKQDTVPELTEKVMRKFNPRWIKISSDSGIYSHWEKLLEKHNFTTYTKTLDIFETYTHNEWLGRVRASPVISGTLTPDELIAFDHEHAEKLYKQFPIMPLIKHKCFILEARSPELTLTNYRR